MLVSPINFPNDCIVQTEREQGFATAHEHSRIQSRHECSSVEEAFARLVETWLWLLPSKLFTYVMKMLVNQSHTLHPILAMSRLRLLPPLPPPLKMAAVLRCLAHSPLNLIPSNTVFLSILLCDEIEKIHRKWNTM